MIAVAVSLFFALYVLGPDAVSRFLLGFTVPRRAVLLTRSEEVSRALVWAGTCLGLAYLWARWSGALDRVWRGESLRVFFAGVYSEFLFRQSPGSWFSSLHDLFWMNWVLLWRLYVIVVLLSIALTFATQYYGWISNRLPGDGLRQVFTAIVLPRVAQWHVLLSRLLLADRSLVIYLDVLTKSDKLYQGTFFDKALAADGSLISVTLASPKRFDRRSYVQAKEAGGQPEAGDFWKEIPTNMFVVMASDINTINFRYAPPQSLGRRLRTDPPELRQLLDAIADQVNAMRARDGVEGPEAVE